MYDAIDTLLSEEAPGFGDGRVPNEVSAGVFWSVIAKRVQEADEAKLIEGGHSCLGITNPR